MVRIVVCRHGQTDENREGVLQGRMDTSLNDRGMNEAEKLSRRIEGEELDHIYTSKLKRAQQTAEKVAERQNKDPEPLDRIQEIDLGELQGKDVEKWHEKILEKEEALHHWKPEKGESMQEVEQRTREALEKFAETHENEQILVVAHGAAIRAIIMGILDTKRDKYLNISQGNTCINILEFHEEIGWVIERLNDTSHLESSL
ncbi:MAG: histidine phosphatase family protein [Candidatus Aenigmatarchaeota archaeon]